MHSSPISKLPCLHWKIKALTNYIGPSNFIWCSIEKIDKDRMKRHLTLLKRPYFFERVFFNLLVLFSIRFGPFFSKLMQTLNDITPSSSEGQPLLAYWDSSYFIKYHLLEKGLNPMSQGSVMGMTAPKGECAHWFILNWGLKWLNESSLTHWEWTLLNGWNSPFWLGWHYLICVDLHSKI